MVITPSTDVILLKCPLELDQENQLNFSNATAQFNYFNGLPKLPLGDDFSYQRKDNVIRAGRELDTLIGYNYVMYRNKNYSNKWFYAFIEGMEYVNDSMTAIKIKTDTFQTWQFDLTYKRCFVEREHVNDDTAGAHTVPEGLEIGEYEIQGLENIPMYETANPSQDWFVCFCVSKLPDNLSTFNEESSNIGGVFSGLHIFAVNSFLAARSYLNWLTHEEANATQDSVINMYMIPRSCVNINNSDWTKLEDGTAATQIGPSGSTVAIYPVWQAYEGDSRVIQQPSVLSGNYSPKNKKLLSWPYSYFYMSNNVGEDVECKYEDFPIESVSGTTARTIRLRQKIVPSAGLSAKLIFKNYKNYQSDNTYGTSLMSYGVNYAKVPTCAWTTDYWLNWLTQNSVNIVSSSISAGAAAGVGLATANPAGIAGGIANTLAQTMSVLGEVQKAYTTPPQAHGDIATGDAVYAFKRNSISLYKMSIRPEMARIVDDYFSAYGYKVNRVKIPNITGRANWNYVKTIGCYIQANIPQEDLQEIKDMFNRGLTIWHHASTFMDYSQSNAII